ncbi:MAG: Crp/Fnr family transcriptional regulator [Trueperaceae bacterium]|nr:Crp/Fnr family transcriptional regulator [Trueperaceae bacterium]
MDEGSHGRSHSFGPDGWPVDGLGPGACTLDMRRRVLGSVPYFTSLDEDDLAVVHASFHAVPMAAGSALVVEGEGADRFFVIASGRVKLQETTATGGVHLLDVLGPGGSFGALPLLGQARNEVGAEALTGGCLLVASAQEFGGIVRAFPAVALAVLEAVASRLRDAQVRLRDAGTSSVEARLARSLLTLSERLGRPEQAGAGRTLGAPLSQEDLAALTGSTLETVNRVLAQWRARGMVTTGRRRLTLVDLPALREVAEG